MLHCCDPRPEKARRVVSLHVDAATQEKLRQWCIDAGFDLGWNYDGWPIDPDYFRFHVTLLATKNEVEIEDRWQPIGALSVTPAGFAVLGADRRVPVLTLEGNQKLTAMREFFIASFDAEPTFPEFTPHISLSYKWDGAPDLSKLSPPSFPLTFDALVVAVLEAKTKSKDAAMTAASMQFSDTMQIGGTRRTKDGYLVADVRAARTGIQQYAGVEVGRPDLQTVSVYRPAEEVFKQDSLASYAFKPVTVDHPRDGVSAETWKQLAVGNVGGDVVRDGGFVRVPLVVMDAAAIDHIENGKRELSMGYECRLEFVDGVTPDGQAYQAVQRDIRINHAAIVERGRAGPQCRIGDKGNPGGPVKREPSTTGDNPMTTRNITVDGITIAVTDQGAQVIEKLQAQLADGKTALTTAQQALADANAKAAKDAADHAKALKDAEAKIPTVDQLEAMFAKRADVIDVAKVLLPDFDPKGKPLPEVRKAVVAKQLGDEAVNGKDDAAIAPMFDTLAALAKKGGGQADPVRDALKNGATTVANDASKARDKALELQRNAWSQ
jgi:hypothetical protein